MNNSIDRRRKGRTAWLSLACGIGLSGCAATTAFVTDLSDLATPMTSVPKMSTTDDPATLRLQPLAPTSRVVSTRSYSVGAPYTSRVGEPMLSVKNYAVAERVATATALRDFEQLCERLLGKDPGRCTGSPLGSVRADLGSLFEVRGAVATPDGEYFAVSMPVTDKGVVIYLLVDPEGRLRRGAYVAWHRSDTRGSGVGGVPLVEVVPEIPLDTDSPMFTFENQQSIAERGPGYLNYELVYVGSRSTGRGDNLLLSYREYARQKTDYLVFEQGLQYPASQRDIEVAGLRLHVDAVDPEKITFRVVEDAQRGAEHK